MIKVVCTVALALIVIWPASGQSIQSAQERFEEFRRRANADYEHFREEALNSYADFLERAWQDYEVVQGHCRDNTPKPTVQPTISNDKKTPSQILQTAEAVPDATNSWFSTLQWEGSRLKRIIDKSVNWVRSSTATTVAKLSNIAKERRKTVSERLKNLNIDSENYISPSQLRRLKREKLANKQSVDNSTKTPYNTAEQSRVNASNKKSETEGTTSMQEKSIALADAMETSSTSVNERDSTIDINLYGLDMSISAPGIMPQTFTSTSLQLQIAAYWKKINNANLNAVIDELTEISLLYKLGDWCTFKAVEQYATVWAGKHDNAKNIMMQYLLLNMGYDVRVAESNGNVLLLLPFQQQVYGCPYVMLEDNRYYLYPHGGSDIALLRTGVLPKELVCDQMNLIKSDPIVLPADNKVFTVQYGDLKVTGNLNLNVIRMQQEYPLMDTPNYAASIHDENLHFDIVEQLKKQVEGLSEQDAANVLLHFVEHGFKYMTDGEQFGANVEKPFFFEEILYHPYCDCEDRSIFYSYIVKQVLGLDVVLVHFPGHACTAVAFSETPVYSNAAYTYKGKRYYICDPTYITADVGMCMPNYSNADPIFQEWYHIEKINM